jgi:hypothetical protein
MKIISGEATMRQSQSSPLTQSRFYSPAFNAAIFDGPVRIYFAQYQESLALQVYFHLQERMREWASPSLRPRLPNIFIMLYPTAEIFSNCFSPEQSVEALVIEKLGEDHVLGTCGPITDVLTDHITTKVRVIIEKCVAQFRPQPPSPLAVVL